MFMVMFIINSLSIAIYFIFKYTYKLVTFRLFQCEYQQKLLSPKFDRDLFERCQPI